MKRLGEWLGRECLIALPDEISERGRYPLVLALHGSGRGAIDYETCPFYAMQVRIALSQGCMFAVLSNGTDTWGTDEGVGQAEAFLRFLAENYPIEREIALWATSAGGVCAHRLTARLKERVVLVLGTFPVYDLKEAFSLPSCRAAWGCEERDAFLARIEGKNPPSFAQALRGRDYLIVHGTEDRAVPIEAHSRRLVRDLGEGGMLLEIEGGVHSTENFAYYPTALRTALARFADSFKGSGQTD